MKIHALANAPTAPLAGPRPADCGPRRLDRGITETPEAVIIGTIRLDRRN